MKLFILGPIPLSSVPLSFSVKVLPGFNVGNFQKELGEQIEVLGIDDKDAVTVVDVDTGGQGSRDKVFGKPILVKGWREFVVTPIDVYGNSLFNTPIPGSWLEILPIDPRQGFGCIFSKPGGGLVVILILKSSGVSSTFGNSGPVGIVGVAVLNGTFRSV